MKVLEKLTLVWMSFIVFSLVFVGISNAKIDKKALEGLWLFDEGKGNIAQDSSDKGNDGDIDGPKWVNTH